MQHTTVYAKKNGLSHKTTLNTGYKKGYTAIFVKRLEVKV